MKYLFRVAQPISMILGALLSVPTNAAEPPPLLSAEEASVSMLRHLGKLAEAGGSSTEFTAAELDGLQSQIDRLIKSMNAGRTEESKAALTGDARHLLGLYENVRKNFKASGAAPEPDRIPSGRKVELIQTRKPPTPEETGSAR